MSQPFQRLRDAQDRFKTVLKRSARRLGFDVRRYNPASAPSAQLGAMLSRHQINLILDVGANIGQFAKSARDAGYRGRIVSFEPLHDAHGELLAATLDDPNWDVAARMALGEADGAIKLFRANNSASSSVLEMLEAHATAAVGSHYIGNEMVPMQRLDVAAAQYISDSSVVFLKVDTQGYEDRVLNGATKTLPQVTGLQLELSIVPLYEGQQLLPEMLERVLASGFELWGMTPTFVDPASGRLLQLDATFFRR